MKRIRFTLFISILSMALTQGYAEKPAKENGTQTQFLEILKKYQTLAQDRLALAMKIELLPEIRERGKEFQKSLVDHLAGKGVNVVPHDQAKVKAAPESKDLADARKTLAAIEKQMKAVGSELDRFSWDPNEVAEWIFGAGFEALERTDQFEIAFPDPRRYANALSLARRISRSYTDIREAMNHRDAKRAEKIDRVSALITEQLIDHLIHSPQETADERATRDTLKTTFRVYYEGFHLFSDENHPLPYRRNLVHAARLSDPKVLDKLEVVILEFEESLRKNEGKTIWPNPKERDNFPKKLGRHEINLEIIADALGSFPSEGPSAARTAKLKARIPADLLRTVRNRTINAEMPER
jgi:hypothetical protein